MDQNTRGRAWRRHQRQKYINRRGHLLYDPNKHAKTVLLWQLWVGGHPTDVLHKQAVSGPVEEIPPDRVVGEVVGYQNLYWGWRHETSQTETQMELANGEVVTCTHLTSRCVFKPPIGSVWKCIRIHTVEHRGIRPGQLDKSRNPQDAASTHWSKPHGKDKRWKMQAGRTAKIARARQLGMDYEAPDHWREWVDSDL